MKRLPWLIFALPTVLTVAILGICLALQRHNAPALDGQGPDPTIIAVVLLAWALGIALAITTLYSLLATQPRLSGQSQRARAAAYHLVLWLAVGGVLAAPYIQERLWWYRMGQTPEWKAPNTIAKGTLSEVERAYTQARAETHDLPLLNDQMKSAALEYLRVDVLKFLKSQGVSFAEPGQEEAWIDSVIQVLRASDGHQPQATLDTVQWLMDEGAAPGFSLKARASDFSTIDFYFSAYQDINGPATRQLLDLLVAHGGDTVGCNDSISCPLVYLAAKGMTDAVRYLLAQGANPNSVEPGGGDTALAAAIIGHTPETVKVLIQAGARVRFDARKNDIARACEPESGPYANESRAVVRVLREANIHMTAADLAQYEGTIYSDEQRSCMTAFM